MPTAEEVSSHEKGIVNRRSFMRHSLVAGAAATVGAGIFANSNFDVHKGSRGKLTKGDVPLLQLLAAAEIIESDLWHPGRGRNCCSPKFQRPQSLRLQQPSCAS